MSIGKYAIGEGAVGQSEAPAIRSKVPSKRIYTALADAPAIPEPR